MNKLILNYIEVFQKKRDKLLNGNMNLMVLIYFALLFIIDYSGIMNLYGENFVRRLINMFRRTDELTYIKKLKPFCQKYDKILSNDEIKQLQCIKIPDTRDIFWLSRINTTTHQCCKHWSEKEITIINDISIKVKERYEKIIGKKLYNMKSNTPTIYVYHGKDSKHLWHVDPKNINIIYNIIICIDRKGVISPLQCKDINNNITDINFEPGDAALFNGGTTVHQVPPNNDPNSKRTVLALAFSSNKEFAETIENKNMCTFIEGGNNKFNILILIFSIFIINLIISKIIDIDKISIKFLISIILFTLIITKYVPLYFDIGLGSGRSSCIMKNIQLLIISMIFTLSIKGGNLFLIYFILSDVFFPRKWVEYD